MRAKPHVEILVDHYEEDWSALWWVRLRGSARVLERGDDELGRALELLAAKYPQYRAEPPPGPVLAVDLDSWTGWHARRERLMRFGIGLLNTMARGADRTLMLAGLHVIAYSKTPLAHSA